MGAGKGGEEVVDVMTEGGKVSEFGVGGLENLT